MTAGRVLFPRERNRKFEDSNIFDPKEIDLEIYRGFEMRKKFWGIGNDTCSSKLENSEVQSQRRRLAVWKYQVILIQQSSVSEV